MNTFLDGFLVGAILLAGFGYAIYSLGPRSLRARIRFGASAVLGRLPSFTGLGAAARRLANEAPSGACGGCDSCGSEKPTAQSFPEVSIPLSKIGRRS